MKVLVTVKECIDYQVKVRLNANQTQVETDGVQQSVNPFDAIALEAVVAMQEQNIVTASTAIHIGSDTKVLQHALAMGVDQGVLIKTDNTDTFSKCQMLEAYIKAHQFDFIIMGKLAIDGDHGQIPQMLAGMLNWPCATYASKIDIKDGIALVDRETDQGIETVQMHTPCIISTDLRLNEPRFIALPKLLAAKNKPIETFPTPNVTDSMIKVTKLAYPDKKTGCTPTEDIDTFIQQLTDAGLIK
ncbi:electron transfer flavoprotein subunit beta/FixA family protein [Gammaproteobacteria bacterium]|nr:electron transfer flavoprotein subunit beta/FixA family protein [Gammaproteobacteria bacterium]